MPENSRSDTERVKDALPPVDELIEDDGAVFDTGGSEYRTDHPIHGSSSSGGNLTVNPQKGMWHCKRPGHGGGDKLAWIAVSSGICDCADVHGGIPRSLFGDVLEIAAGRAGVELSGGADLSDDVRAARKEHDKLRRGVAEFYHRMLDKHGMRQALKDRYGFSDDLIDEKRLGYAPPSGIGHDVPDALGCEVEDLANLGVLRPGGEPTFQERFIFPYWEHGRGDLQVRYFVGRATEPASECTRAKYLKIAKNDDVHAEAQGEPPFGTESIRGHTDVVFAEGVTDALALQDHGFAAVSPVTTSIDSDVVDRFANPLRGKDVYVVYDADDAGITGAASCAKMLDDAGVDARVGRVPSRPNESVDVNDWLCDHDAATQRERAEAFREDVIDGMTYPAPVANWAWGDGKPADVFAAAIRELGYDPARASSYTNDDGDTCWLSVHDLVGDVDKIQEARRRFYNDGGTRWSAGDHKEAYYCVIRWVFESRGEFFKTDAGGVYYYYSPENRCVEVCSESKPDSASAAFVHLVNEVFGITPADWGRSLLDSVASAVCFDADVRPTGRLAYYDDERGELYLNRFDGHYYALDGESVERRRNGTDVFFLTDDGEPWVYREPSERSALPDAIPGEQHPFTGQGDRVQRLICNRINFDEDANLGPTLQRSQLYIHLHAMAFVNDFSGKPIMAWVGQKGSGKTVVLRSIGQFLFGPDWSESTMPAEEDDFVTKVTNQTLAAIDNYDDGVKWANDMLAAIATGASVEKRKLYTDGTLEKMVPECFLALTSRDPPFRRDDVADRCLVFRVDRVEGDFVSESKYLWQIALYRDDLWSDYVDNLNKILRERQANEDPFRTTTHRMADWALFAQDAGDALDVPRVDELLGGMQTERAFFALENEPLRIVIEEWLSDHPDGGEFTAGELVDDFEAAASEAGVAFKYNSSRGLSNALSSLSDELSELFDMEVIDTRNGAKRYRFPGGGTQYMLGYGDEEFAGDARPDAEAEDAVGGDEQ